jgi:hypothetical protein
LLLNLASQILAAATTVLPDPWLARCGYAPLLAETFTNPEAHAGTCYKAAGWEPVGKTVGLECHRCDFFAVHDYPKRLWLKPPAPNAKEKLCAHELSARQAPPLNVGAAARRSSLKDTLRQATPALSLGALSATPCSVEGTRARTSGMAASAVRFFRSSCSIPRSTSRLRLVVSPNLT